MIGSAKPKLAPSPATTSNKPKPVIGGKKPAAPPATKEPEAAPAVQVLDNKLAEEAMKLVKAQTLVVEQQAAELTSMKAEIESLKKKTKMLIGDVDEEVRLARLAHLARLTIPALLSCDGIAR